MNKNRVLPIIIEVLLNAHSWPSERFYQTLAHSNAVDELIRDGIIESNPPSGKCILTERGKVWLEQILSTPYPVVKWIDPRFGE